MPWCVQLCVETQMDLCTRVVVPHKSALGPRYRRRKRPQSSGFLLFCISLEHLWVNDKLFCSCCCQVWPLAVAVSKHSSSELTQLFGLYFWTERRRQLDVKDRREWRDNMWKTVGHHGALMCQNITGSLRSRKKQSFYFSGHTKEHCSQCCLQHLTLCFLCSQDSCGINWLFIILFLFLNFPVRTPAQIQVVLLYITAVLISSATAASLIHFWKWTMALFQITHFH